MNGRTKLRALSALAVLTLVASGCAERNDPTDVDIRPHPRAWTQPGQPDFHGHAVEAAQDRDDPVEFCRSCHGADLGHASGDNCFACHGDGGAAAHPESSVWMSKVNDGFHGRVVAEQSGAQDCALCHGKDWKSGWSQVSCFTCHAGGPSGHPATTDWLNPNSLHFHGNEAEQNGTADCAACHGADFTGGWSGVSCFTCHQGGASGHPSPQVWLNPSDPGFHGQVVIDSMGYDACAACHGEDFTGGWAGASCYTCHAGGPSGHPDRTNWLTDGSLYFHGDVVAESGSQECAQCHGSDFAGGWTGVGCSDCHAGGASGHPASEEWLDPTSSEFHGLDVAAAGPSACSGCHGDDYLGGSAGVSCFGCHGGGPSGHPDPSVWVENDDNPGHHSKFFSADPNRCMTCHGAALDGGTAGLGCWDTCHRN